MFNIKIDMRVCNFVYCHNVGTNCKPSSIRDITQSSLLRTARRSNQLYFSDTSCRILPNRTKKCGKQNISFIVPSKVFLTPHRTARHSHRLYFSDTSCRILFKWDKKCGKQNIHFHLLSPVKCFLHRADFWKNLHLLNDPTWAHSWQNFAKINQLFMWSMVRNLLRL